MEGNGGQELGLESTSPATEGETQAEQVYPFSDPAKAREAAARSVEVRTARRLLPSDVVEALGELVTVEDCKRWLTLAGRWCATGQLDKGPAAVLVKACSEWCRAHDLGEVEASYALTRKELATVKAELARERSKPNRRFA